MSSLAALIVSADVSPDIIWAIHQKPKLQPVFGVVFGRFQIFWGTLEPENRLYYIYISPYVDGRDEEAHCKYYVDPHKLAEKMFGNALVFYADDMDFTEEMRYMSPDYACYGGALRVYQPNTTEAARHRYMSRDDLVLLGEETVIKSLIRAFAQNVKFYESFLRMEQCQKLRTDLQRKKRLEELNRQHQAQMNEVESQKLDEAI